MTIQFFISGVILGCLLTLLCSRLSQGWQRRARRKPDMDQLIEQFQALFRQLDREKHQRP